MVGILRGHYIYTKHEHAVLRVILAVSSTAMMYVMEMQSRRDFSSGRLRRKSSMTSRMKGITLRRVLPCFVPDGNASAFAIATGGGDDGDDSDGGGGGGGGGDDSDGGGGGGGGADYSGEGNEKASNLREAYLRGVWSVKRAQPNMDLKVMLFASCSPIFPALAKGFHWNVFALLRAFCRGVLPTGLFDLSILTRTVAGCGSSAVILYSWYLIRRDIDAWIARRERLIMMFRLLLPVFAYFIGDLMGRERVCHVEYNFKIFLLRFFILLTATTVSPVRFERHVLTEALRFPLMIVNGYCAWNARHTIIDGVVAMACHVLAGTVLFCAERTFRDSVLKKGDTADKDKKLTTVKRKTT